jgi:hypothetical protein
MNDSERLFERCCVLLSWSLASCLLINIKKRVKKLSEILMFSMKLKNIKLNKCPKLSFAAQINLRDRDSMSTFGIFLGNFMQIKKPRLYTLKNL